MSHDFLYLSDWLCRELVHVVSSEDMERQAYSLEDVVLPVLGTSILYPHNRVADK